MPELRHVCIDGLRSYSANCFTLIGATEMVKRDTPGYAIGGLSGGESKDLFWPVVKLCGERLPQGKPRYLMGVGSVPRDTSYSMSLWCRYAVDLVICSALGVDMFDCVYPTRTAVWLVAVE